MFQAFNIVFWFVFGVSTIFIVGMIVFIVATIVKGRKNLGSNDAIAQTLQNVNRTINQEKENEKPWICPYCGEENDQHDLKCTSCGAKQKGQKDKK